MDAAGLGLGILATSNVVMRVIRLVRVGQDLSHDYQIFQLKFQLTERRLVRWGVLVGIAVLDRMPTSLSEST